MSTPHDVSPVGPHDPNDLNSQPAPAYDGPAPDPGSSLARLVAWVALIVVVGYTAWFQWLGPAPTYAPAEEITPPGGLVTLGGRYVVGSANLTSIPPEMADQLMEQFSAFAVLPEDRLRGAIVEAELRGTEAAAGTVDEFLSQLGAGDGAPLLYEDQLRADAEAFRGLLQDPPVSPADTDGLRERHGWFAELALAQGLDENDPARASAIGAGQRTLIVAVIGLIGFGVVAFAGIVLFILAVVFVSSGKLKMAYEPVPAGGSVYLEVFALFVAAFIGVSALAGVISVQTGADVSNYFIWLLLLVPLWARFRGAGRARFARAMGWHRGTGVLREVFAGVVGYVACVPIFLLGIGLTLALSVVSGLLQGSGGGEGAGAPPTHPILDAVDPRDLMSVLGVYMVAAVWAPLVEESLFRGAFYHHVRSRLHPVLAAMAVGFVFAVIHPQGLVAIPALMSLGVVFSVLREWRGSIIAPVIAHALHNGTLMTGLILALG